MVEKQVEQFLVEHTRRTGRFTLHDWDALIERINGEIVSERRDDAWGFLEQRWHEQLVADCGPGYSSWSSDNFSLVANAEEGWCRNLLGFMETTRAQIFDRLPGIVSTSPDSLLYALVLGDIDTYYDYVANFYPEEGEFSLTGGMYIYDGYSHLVLQKDDPTYIQPVVAHELTHAYLSHLPLPLWLNEGIAVSMEHVISGGVPSILDAEMIERYRAFWTPGTIQEFWTGATFSEPGEASVLSYHLAQLLVKSLSRDFDLFARFVSTSHRDNAGESAAVNVFESGLGEVIRRLLGEGEWAPKRANGSARGNNQSALFI